jgi:hypothetical protein
LRIALALGTAAVSAPFSSLEGSHEVIPSPGEMFDLIQKIEFRRAKDPGFLHLRSQLFTLTKLASLLKIPLEKHNYFIRVIGATEDLSPFGTSGLAVGAV